MVRVGKWPVAAKMRQRFFFFFCRTDLKCLQGAGGGDGSGRDEVVGVFQVRRSCCPRRTTSRPRWWRSEPWWGSTRPLRVTWLLTRTEWSRSPPSHRNSSKSWNREMRSVLRMGPLRVALLNCCAGVSGATFDCFPFHKVATKIHSTAPDFILQK